MPTGSGLPKAPRRTSANIKITTRDQVKGDSAIDTVIRQLQRRCNELESSLTLASNAPTVTPALQRHLDLHWALLRQVGQHTWGRSPGRSRASSIYLHILQSSLRGEARNVLTGTAFSQGGYDDTWLRLKARYKNGKILVFAAIAKMIDHKPRDGSSRQLRALHDTIKTQWVLLKTSIAQNPGFQ